MELPRLHYENEYLGETLSNNISPLSIGILREECINCDAPLFLAKHGRIKHNCCHYSKVELTSVNYPVDFKKTSALQSF